MNGQNSVCPQIPAGGEKTRILDGATDIDVDLDDLLAQAKALDNECDSLQEALQSARDGVEVQAWFAGEPVSAWAAGEFNGKLAHFVEQLHNLREQYGMNAEAFREAAGQMGAFEFMLSNELNMRGPAW